MKKFEITEEMLEAARSRDNGAFNSNSFMDGKGNVVGFLGEELVKSKFPFTHSDEFNYDFEYKGFKIEVKTKTQTVPYDPPPHYEASIATTSMFQDTDIYIFCRIYKDITTYKYGWILGWITAENFKKKAKFWKKGDRDLDNDYIVKQDCYNIAYKDLNKFKWPV